MGRPLNILVSTTHGFNLGDDFIRLGCQYLLESILGSGQNWFFWNRNPDLDGKTQVATNAVSEARLDRGTNWDLVVFAGTPEWCGPRVRALTEHLLRNKNIPPVIYLGIGSSAAHEGADASALALMHRPQTLVIVRNPSLRKKLKTQGIEAELLPCPAFFSADQLEVAPAPDRILNLLTFQTHRDALYQEVPTQRFDNCMKVAQRPSWQLVAHYVSEAMDAAARGLPVRYAASPLDLMRIYASGRAVASTRLHGSIAALSCGVPAILIGPDEHRLTNAAQVFGSSLPVMTTQQATGTIENWPADQIIFRQQEVAQFKSHAKKRYQQLLRSFFPEGHQGAS
jgi:hypothetical protein